MTAGSPKGPSEENVSATAATPEVFEGPLGTVEIRPASRVVYVVFLALVVTGGWFAHVASSEEWIRLVVAVTEEPTAQQQARDAVDEAMRLRARGLGDEAYALLREAHDRHPEEPIVNRELGRHHMERGLWVFAAEYFDLAAEKLSASHQLLVLQGELHRRWGESWERRVAGGDGTDDPFEALSEALRHFTTSVEFFRAAEEMAPVYGREDAHAGAMAALDGSFRCRLEIIARQARHAQGVFRTNRDVMRKALRDLVELLAEEGLSPERRRQADELKRGIEAGRVP